MDRGVKDVLARFSPLLSGRDGRRLIDAFAGGQGREPRATVPGGRCIDFIFGIETTDGITPRFDGTRVVLDRPHPRSGVLPSDHFGVMTIATWGGAAQP